MLYLTQEEARAHVLGRHGLAQPYATPLEALHAVFAIQTQYAASLPVALALRTKELKSNWHHKEEHRDVLKSWTLRHTVHAHTAEDLRLALGAVGEPFFQAFCRWLERAASLSETQVRHQCEQVAGAIQKGPLTRQEIHELVPSLKSIPMAGWGADVKGLAYQGRMKMIVTEGGPTRFALHECGILPTREEALQEIMRRYFSAYGPATLADFKYWLGVPLNTFQSVFQEIREEFQEVEVEGMKGKRYLYGDPVSCTVPKANLLAKFDPLTMGHADKTLFLDDKYREKVLRKAAQVEAAVLIEGKMAGTWRFARKGKGGEVLVEPFKKIAQSRHAGIEREAKKAMKSLGLNLIGVNYVSS